MELQQVPGHLMIIGGGYIGLEFGQMYRRFGSRVTILEHNDRLLPKEDEDIAAEVLKFLQEEEIDVLTNAEVIKVKKENGSIVAKIKKRIQKKGQFNARISWFQQDELLIPKF